MTIWSFMGMMLIMLAALVVGLRASRKRKQELRDAVLKNRAELSNIAELVRQKKSYQAESMLMSRGNSRTVARTTVVIIRELLKSGAWDEA